MKVNRFGILFFLCVMVTLIPSLALNAIADISVKNIPDYVDEITIGGGTEMFFLVQKNAYGIDENDYNWIDGTFRLNTTVSLKSDIEFKLGVIYSGTFGEDYYGFEDTSEFNADEAYIKFKTLLDLPVDITLGRQKINVEKGFLMSEGNLDFSTNVYGNGQKASPFAARADINLDSITLLAYWETIATDDEYAAFGKGNSIQASGLNIHASFTEDKYVYLGAVRWLATDNPLYDDNFNQTGDLEQDLLTYYIGTDLTFGPINFTAEYAKQGGDNTDHWSGVTVDQDATAYNAFLKLSFNNVALMPWIEVGTMYFSGDDAGTEENENFNTMTLGFPDWGKYCPGELFGEQIYFGAPNWVDYTAQIGIMPTETTQIRLQYHNVSLAEDNGGDDSLYDEYNLIFEFFPDDKLYCGIVIGVATPNDAQEDMFGDDETAYGVMPYLIYNF